MTEAEKKQKAEKKASSTGTISPERRGFACQYCGEKFIREKTRIAHEKFCDKKIPAKPGEAEKPKDSPPEQQPLPGAPPPTAFDTKEIEFAIAATLDWAANTYGEHWRTPPEHISIIARPWAKVIEKYAPKLNDNPLWGAAAVTAIFIGPKAGKQFALNKESKRKREQGSTGNSRPGGERENDNASESPKSEPESTGAGI